MASRGYSRLRHAWGEGRLWQEQDDQMSREPECIAPCTSEDTCGMDDSTDRRGSPGRNGTAASILAALLLLPTCTGRSQGHAVSERGGKRGAAAAARVRTVGGENMVSDRFVTPRDFEGTDVERINQAIEAGAAAGLAVVVPPRSLVTGEGRGAWLLDSAVLVRSNTTLVLDNCRVKLSDSCRDNMIRSANCDLGVTEIAPLHDITISGRGNAVLEGADRPRATGDSAKTIGRDTYGTDAGVRGESQTGDWRNVGVLLAHVQRFRIENLEIRDSHCWAVSLERCADGVLRDIRFDSSGWKLIDGERQTVLNQDGIDLRQGCRDITIENITGHTGDDLIALTAIRHGPSDAGTDISTMVSGAGRRDDGADDIRNIIIRNVRGHSRGGHHVVRLLNAGGLRIHDVILDGLLDSSPAHRPCKATIKIGDANPAWGGVTSVGDTTRLIISNVVSASRHTVLIAGSLTDSCISNVLRQRADGEPITCESGRDNVRGVLLQNVVKAGDGKQ